MLLEYDDHWWTARFAEALMPKVANGIHLDADIARARAENLEFEARGNRIAHRTGVVRLLAYLNHANMGNYEEANADYLDRVTPTPDITFTRRQGRRKYGFGLNFEQAINSQVGVFGRLGWSDGRNESFAYTEDDRTLELGGFTMGKAWHRRNDRAGAVFVANGIVAAHQQYLAMGGLGFLLGDGGLTYGPEKIFEGFYTAHLWRGFFASFDLQHINNPGYNQARGPVTVPGLRFHVDFSRWQADNPVCALSHFLLRGAGARRPFVSSQHRVGWKRRAFRPAKRAPKRSGLQPRFFQARARVHFTSPASWAQLVSPASHPAAEAAGKAAAS